MKDGSFFSGLMSFIQDQQATLFCKPRRSSRESLKTAGALNNFLRFPFKFYGSPFDCARRCRCQHPLTELLNFLVPFLHQGRRNKKNRSAVPKASQVFPIPTSSARIAPLRCLRSALSPRPSAASRAAATARIWFGLRKFFFQDLGPNQGRR